MKKEILTYFRKRLNEEFGVKFRQSKTQDYTTIAHEVLDRDFTADGSLAANIDNSYKIFVRIENEIAQKWGGDTLVNWAFNKIHEPTGVVNITCRTQKDGVK